MTKESIIEEIRNHSPEEQLEILKMLCDASDPQYNEQRVALTRHYKYKIIYRIKDDVIVRILTVRHPRQHPAFWMV